jgi:hypothetical protein
MNMDVLPPRSRERLTALSDTISESSVLIASHIRRVNELRASLGNVFAHGKNAEAQRDLARMLTKQSAAQVRFRELSALLATLQHFLQNLPSNVVLVDLKHPKPKIRGSATEAVEGIREKIKALRRDIVAVQRAVPTPEEMKAAARETVKANADRARPKVNATNHGKMDIVFGALDFSTRAITPFEHLCWLNPDDVIAKLDAEIDAQPKSALALSAVDKAARLEELSAAMLALERDEEALIASSPGQEIARRPQADPRAVLGVTIVKKAKMPEATEVAA